MIAWLDRRVFGPVSRARAYLLMRAMLLLVGLHCVIELVPHGGRYGVSGFNVAHFPVLDRFLPVPTPSLYVGAVLATAGLCFASVVLGPRRPILAAITALYTWAWACSLLDAYQHHYLTSLWLVSMTAIAGDDDERVDGVAPNPGVRSFVWTCAIVYGFAAIAKLDHAFLAGDALGRILPEDLLEALVFHGLRFGLGDAELLAWLARGAVALEVVAALAFALATRLDELEPPRANAVRFLSLAPIGFHLAVARLELGIGWFGETMLLVVALVFAPRGVLERLATRLRGIGRAALAAALDDRFSRWVFGALALALAIPAIGSIALPGTLGASAVVVGLVVAVAASPRAAPRVRSRAAIAVGVAGILVAGAVSHPRIGCETASGFVGLEASSVRYDYHRFVGGDAARRGLTDRAREAYTLAERFAPDEATRRRARDTRDRLMLRR